MKNKFINRRDFLKDLGVFFMSVVFFPLEKLFKGNRKEGQQSPLKEAKYYTGTDQLLG